jgi:uncharacterized membrane protein YdjX (TVP38/TMEM64 family)
MNYKKAALLFFWLLATAASFLLFSKYGQQAGMTLYESFVYHLLKLQMLVGSQGTSAYVLYYLLCILRPLLLVPMSALAIVGVTVFGPEHGWLIAYIGENLSASIAYVIGRYFSRESTYARIQRSTFGRRILKHNFISILGFRLLPLPVDLISYGAGFMRVRYDAFFFATLFGTIPSLLAQVFLGYGIIDRYYIVLTIAFFIVLILLQDIKKKHILTKKS